MGFGYKDSGGKDYKGGGTGYKESKEGASSGGYGSSMGYKSSTGASSGGFGLKGAGGLMPSGDNSRSVVSDPTANRRDAEAKLLTERIAEEKAKSQKAFEDRQAEQKRWEQKQFEMKQFMEKKAHEQKLLDQQKAFEESQRK